MRVVFLGPVHLEILGTVHGRLHADEPGPTVGLDGVAVHLMPQTHALGPTLQRRLDLFGKVPVHLAALGAPSAPKNAAPRRCESSTRRDAPTTHARVARP